MTQRAGRAAPVPEGTLQRQLVLIECGCPAVIALPVRAARQTSERGSDARLIPEFLQPRQGFRVQGCSVPPVALQISHRSRGQQGLRPEDGGDGWVVGACCERRFEPAAAFREVPPWRPEHLERRGEAHHDFRLLLVERPVEGSAQVLVFGLQALEPADLR